MRRLAVGLGLILATPAFAASPVDRTGPQIFAAICSMCHIEDTPGMRAPSINALRRLTPLNIKDALTLGAMMDIGNGLSDREIDNLAAYLTDPSSKTESPPSKAD
jgi:mono/diheme cytochrome c family protein